MHEMKAAGYETYICSENPKQFDRLAAIFKELKADVQFLPVEIPIHEGFIDEDLKIEVLTDHQSSQRYHQYKVRRGLPGSGFECSGVEGIDCGRFCDAY